MSIKTSAFLSFLLFHIAYAYAQTAERDNPAPDSISHILSYINKAMLFNQRVPQEKVYLHFDNTSYFEGETIWFKAYVVRTDSCRASDLSRVLYVELLNPTGDVIRTKKYKIDGNGTAHGEIVLDTIYGSGFYEVRAYTRYMTNWGVNACFSRVFPVYEPVKQEGDYSSPVIRTTSWRKRDPNSRDRSDSLYLTAIEQGIHDSDLRKTLSVSFYPEGGHLVRGLPCRVAMMAVDDNGRAYQGEGWVTNAKEEVVARVTTDSLGRGIFSITPDGAAMRLQIRNLKDKTQYFELPATMPEGCALALDDMGDTMLARLRCTQTQQGRLLAYVVINGGNIIRADTMTASPLIEIEFNRKHLPRGVSQITVVGSDGGIVAERLFFIPPVEDSADSVAVATTTTRPNPCGKVSVELKARPGANLSFTAMDATAMKNGTYGNIRTWMLLGSDVRGYVHNVDYYFEADDMEHRRAADMLMLTQGWRRYDWMTMTYQKPLIDPQPVEEGLTLYGRLRPYRKRNTVGFVDLDVYLYNHKGHSLRGQARTDIYGNYAFSLPEVEGEWVTQIFTKLEGKRKTYRVAIDRQFSPVPRYITPLEAARRDIDRPNLFTGMDDSVWKDTVYVPLTKREHVLRNVTVKAKRRYFTNDDWQYKNESWGRQFATIYYDIDRELDKIRDRGEVEPTIFEFLCKRNPFFNDPEAKFVPTAPIIPPSASTEDMVKNDDGYEWNGHIAYDHRPISWRINNGWTEIHNASSGEYGFKGGEFFPLDLSEIKSIYIQPYNPRSEGGEVRIYIYLHHKFTTESNKGLRKTYFEGYNVPQTFQMEDYSKIPPMEDFRRTLYWQPDVRTDSEGKAKVEFYNNSSCREMFISVEGMTQDGKFLTNE